MTKKNEKRGVYLKTKSIEEVSARQVLVTQILSDFKSQRLKFEGISHLSQAVASAMTKSNKALAISDKSLLKRKSSYRSMLEDYLGNSFSIKKREQELQQSLMMEQLKTKSLEKKLSTLTTELSKLNERNYRLEELSLSNRTHGQLHLKDTKCHSVLYKVMNMLAGDFLEVNSQGVFDISEAPKKCVLSPSDYPEFFEWLDEDSSFKNDP